MSDKNGTVEEKEKTRLFWKKEKELMIIDKNQTIQKVKNICQHFSKAIMTG